MHGSTHAFHEAMAEKAAHMLPGYPELIMALCHQQLGYQWGLLPRVLAHTYL